MCSTHNDRCDRLTNLAWHLSQKETCCQAGSWLWGYSPLKHLLHGSKIHLRRTLATGADGVAVTPDFGAWFLPFGASKFHGSASGMRWNLVSYAVVTGCMVPKDVVEHPPHRGMWSIGIVRIPSAPMWGMHMHTIGCCGWSHACCSSFLCMSQGQPAYAWPVWKVPWACRFWGSSHQLAQQWPCDISSHNWALARHAPTIVSLKQWSPLPDSDRLVSDVSKLLGMIDMGEGAEKPCKAYTPEQRGSV